MAKYKANLKNVPATEFVLDEFTRGYAQCVDNNWNYAIFAQDPKAPIYLNEYRAGYVQGKVQGNFAIRCARNNSWNNFTVAATPQDDVNINITPQMLSGCQKGLLDNYNYLFSWAKQHQEEAQAKSIIRLMFRQLGIFEGAVDRTPRQAVTIDDLDLLKIGQDQWVLKTGNDQLTFLDIYFINAQDDLFYAVADQIGMSMLVPPTPDSNKKLNRLGNSDHCTGYVKFMPDGQIFWTHNSWMCFYDNSCAVSYVIGDDCFVTQNATCQGQFGSNTDFGFNKHGIGFNETTHVNFFNKPKVIGLWITWRSAAAEQYAASIEEFYDYLAMDNTATYLNGYMVVDAYRKQIGLVEMSYNRFVLFKSDGKTLTVEDSTGYKPTKWDYDPHLISPTHIFGINQPIDWQVNYELASMNERPMRRNQLYERLDTVVDMATCRDLITYTEDREPLSIYGRWDVGYGTTEFIRMRPDGSADAKAFGTDEMRALLDSLSYKPSLEGSKTSFWMKYGTPYINQKPFIWSESVYSGLKLPESEDNVPDVVDGRWNPVKLFME